MRTHNIKILNDFADAVVCGDKMFEVRQNDRGYQKGDFICFSAVDNTGIINKHIIDEKLYVITFVLNGFGLKNGFVAMGIKESDI